MHNTDCTQTASTEGLGANVQELTTSGIWSLDQSQLRNVLNFKPSVDGRRSPVVACWDSDHWFAGSNPIRGMFHH